MDDYWYGFIVGFITCCFASIVWDVSKDMLKRLFGPSVKYLINEFKNRNK